MDMDLRFAGTCFTYIEAGIYGRHSGEGRNPVQIFVRRTQKQLLSASHGLLKLDSGLRRNDEISRTLMAVIAASAESLYYSEASQ
jgi:hypothetical protein